MPLINTITTSSGTVSAPIQIAIPNGTAANEIMYTVPAGRKFVGRIWNTQNGSSTRINTTYVYTYVGQSTYVTQVGAFWEYYLLAGTVIREGGTGNTTSILGIESAA